MASYSTSSSSSSKLLFRQLFEKESSTYTYLLADASHAEKPAVVSSRKNLIFMCLFDYLWEIFIWVGIIY